MSYPDPDLDPAEPQPPRRDPLRALRRTVGQTVVVFTIPFVVAVGRAALGLGRLKVDRSPVAWTVWIAGVALMVAGSGLAIQMLRGKEPAATGKATAWWAGGLWVAGLVLSIIYSELVPAPTLR